jgi:hypothetical protein
LRRRFTIPHDQNLPKLPFISITFKKYFRGFQK